jgi:predicted DCC family thiol-disulfide oxidoreductase YuxK
MHAAKPESGWVLYDDSCGFCRRWVARFERVLRRRGFEIVPLQSDWVADRLGLSDQQRMHDFRVLLPNGRSIPGADGYRYLMRRIWWTLPLFAISNAPLLRRVFDWSYRMIADHRYAISKTCGIPSRKIPAETGADSPDGAPAEHPAKAK